MMRWPVFAAAFLAAAAASAQPRDAGIVESTDPARAAAVERAAQEIRARAALSGATPPRVGPVHGEAGGIRFVSGGISTGDRVQMHAQRQAYSLWVATVAKPSGAYLTDARLRVTTGPKRTVVLEQTMQGPWLMAALPPGRYEVEATIETEGVPGPQKLSQAITVPARGLRQAVFRFRSSTEVSADMERPFRGNPFGAPAPQR